MYSKLGRQIDDGRRRGELVGGRRVESSLRVHEHLMLPTRSTKFVDDEERPQQYSVCACRLGPYSPYYPSVANLYDGFFLQPTEQ